MNVTTLLTGHETIGDHTEYVIQASCGGVVWLISRRYSDFDQLHLRLRGTSYASTSTFPSLPEKQWFGRFDPNFITKRKTNLQAYLSQLLQIPGILELRFLQQFLELDKNVEIEDASMYSGGALTSSGMSAGTRFSNVDEENASQMMADSVRMGNIVDKAANAFIDVSRSVMTKEGHLSADQALGRKIEILRAVDGFANHLLNTDVLKEQQSELLPEPAAENSAETVVIEDPDYTEVNNITSQLAATVKRQLDEGIKETSLPLVAHLSTSVETANTSTSTTAAASAVSDSSL